MDANKRRRDNEADRLASAWLAETIRGRGVHAYAVLALRNAAEVAVGIPVCPCPDCTIATSMALSLGGDLMARMDDSRVLAAVEEMRDRWYTALPDGGVKSEEDYRTICHNLRLLFPIG